MPWQKKIYLAPELVQYPNKIRNNVFVDNPRVIHNIALPPDKRERVRDMPDAHPLAIEQDSDHIEAVERARRSVPIDPDLCRPRQFTPLSDVNRLHRRPEPFPPPRFDLHKGYHPPLTDNEVDVAVPAAEAMRHNVPALAAQPASRDSLPEEPECLP